MPTFARHLESVRRTAWLLRALAALILGSTALESVAEVSAPASQPAEQATTQPAPPGADEDAPLAAPSTQPSAAASSSRFLPRSPIPEPGETFKTPIPPKTVGKVPPRERRGSADGGGGSATTKPARPTTPAPTGVVPWTEAGRYVGHTITAEGKVVDTHNTGAVCFLNFSNNRQGFYAVLFEAVLKSWPEPPEKHFLGKTIRVTGEVFMHKGRPQVRVREASQVKEME